MLRGASTLIVDVLAITALQRAVNQDQLARVFGAFFALALGGITIGALITPVIVHGIGLNGALWVMALAPAGMAAIGLPSLLRIDRQTAGRAGELAPRVAILEAVGLFAGASRPALERLAAAAEPAPFDAGEVILREGDAADALYILEEGEVQVSARGEAGTERPIRTMQAPAYFGEIGVLEGIPRTATVTAIGDCRCLQIEGDSLLEAMTSAPSTALVDSAKARLAVTHPSRRITYETPVA